MRKRDVADVREIAKLLRSLPAWDDKNMRPKTKIPDCPLCHQSGLHMPYKTRIICNKCDFNIWLD